MSRNPVFIVGNGRSGTTLLQSLLATQENIYSFRESHFFSWVWRGMEFGSSGSITSKSLPRVFELMAEHGDLEFAVGEKKTLRKLSKLGKLPPKVLFEFAVCKYLKKFSIDSEDYILLEKTPGHALQLEKILSIYPTAKFIHIVRHPIPVVYSQKKNFPFVKRMSTGKLAHRWVEVLQAVNSFKNSNPGKVLTIRYEDLVQDLVGTMKSIGDFIGVKVNSGRLDNHKSAAQDFKITFSEWHKGVLDSKIRNTNDTAFKKMSWVNRSQIVRITKEELVRHGYDSGLKLDLLSKFRSLFRLRDGRN